MTKEQNLIDAAMQAHQDALAAQEELSRLAAIRDDAVAAAVAGGVSGATVAQALGISRSRISQILTNRGKQ